MITTSRYAAIVALLLFAGAPQTVAAQEPGRAEEHVLTVGSVLDGEMSNVRTLAFADSADFPVRMRDVLPGSTFLVVRRVWREDGAWFVQYRPETAEYHPLRWRTVKLETEAGGPAEPATYYGTAGDPRMGGVRGFRMKVASPS